MSWRCRSSGFWVGRDLATQRTTVSEISSMENVPASRRQCGRSQPTLLVSVEGRRMGALEGPCSASLTALLKVRPDSESLFSRFRSARISEATW